MKPLPAYKTLSDNLVNNEIVTFFYLSNHK